MYWAYLLAIVILAILGFYEIAKRRKPEAYYNKGQALGDPRIYDDALQAYDKVISLKPNVAEAHYGKGVGACSCLEGMRRR